TSDGWIELATNEFSIDTDQTTETYLRVSDYASFEGVDLDALEVFVSGDYRAQATCTGLADPACSSEEVCMYGHCAPGRLASPILPSDDVRDGVVDYFASRLQLFFGGRYSRETYLPRALEILEETRDATTAWEFWGGFGRAVHALHDWHTDTFGG